MAGEFEVYGATSFIGGVKGDLDNIPTAGLDADDRGAVVSTTLWVPYRINASLGGAENSPWSILPDDEGGNKRWQMIGFLATGFEASVASGDPKLVFDIGGADKFAVGVDDDDSDKFKIDVGASIGGDTALAIDASKNVALGASLTITTIAAGAADYDKFLVSDSGLIKFRSGPQVLSDIGAAASSHDHAAADVTSGTFDNARVAESNVTQHEGAIDHDALANFVGNEHINHTGVTLTAGVGLNGGGDISANRTFTVDLNELVTEGSIAAGDFIAMVDITDNGSGKITFSNFESTLNHDSLAGFVGAEHLSLPNTLANVLTDHNLAAHTSLGLFDASSDVDHNSTTNYVAAEHLSLPNTIANVLTNHTLAVHTSLGLFDASSDVDHNSTTNYVAAEHLSLPNTIANVLTNHTLAVHTALGLFDASSDVDHNQTTNYDANRHFLMSGITQVGTISSGTWQGSSISTSYTAAKCTATWPNSYSANQNLNTNSNVQFYSLKTTSYVGIGVNANYPLHVQMSVGSGYAAYISNTHATDGDGLTVQAGDSASEIILRLMNYGGTAFHKFLADGNVRLCEGGGGLAVNLGASPTYQFQLEDDTASTQVASFFNNGNNANRFGIRIQYGLDNPGLSPGTWSYAVHFYDGDSGLIGYIRSHNTALVLAFASDVKLKQNIRLNTTYDGLKIVRQVRIKDFEWRRAPGIVCTGLISNDIEEYFPEAVGQVMGIKSYSESSFILPLLNAVQRVDTAVSQHEVEILNLKNQVADYEKRIQELEMA